MKISHTAILGAAMALSLPLAAPALAGQQSATPSNGIANSMQATGQWQAQQTVRGKVQSIDQSSGIVELTGQNNEQLKLHFPSTALQNVKNGDRLEVKVAYSTGSTSSSMSGQAGTSGQYSSTGSSTGTSTMGGSAGGTASTGSSGSTSTGGMNWQGSHTMPATVQKVDQSDNTVKVESEGNQLVLPASAQLKLKQGQQIQIHLAMRDLSSSTSSISR